MRGGSGAGRREELMTDEVESFNRDLRSWVKHVTGRAIGDIRGEHFPRSTIYRRTQGGNLLSPDLLKKLITTCAPDAIDEAERPEWIGNQFRYWEQRWRTVEPFTHASTKVRSTSPTTPSEVEDATATALDAVENPRGLQSSIRLVAAQITEAEVALRTSPHAEMLVREISSALGSVAEFIEHAIQGRIVRDGSDLQDLISRTRACQSDIRATTTVTTSALRSSRSWWDSQAAHNYLEDNRRAVARGVEIHRVFIVDKYDDVVESFIHTQVELGVRASWVTGASLASHHVANVLVWDGVIGWRAYMTAMGEVSENWLYTSEGDVARLRSVYDACAGQAKDFV